MKEKKNRPLRRWLLVLLPLVLAALVFWLLMESKKETPKKPPQEASRTYRVIAAQAMDVVPRVLGYGASEPGRLWRAVSRVEGSVTHIHPMLRSGAVMDGETVLLKIDPAFYEAAVSEATAGVEKTKAELAEFEQQVKNDRASLKIEETSLKVARRQLERSQGLLKKDAISQAEVDNDERRMLDQQKRVQDLKNRLKLAPTTRKAKKASLDARRADLEKAELNLANTVIQTPFRVMLADVDLEKGQVVKTGEHLFDGYGTRMARVDAEIPHEKIGRLLNPETLEKLERALRSSQRNRALEGLFDITVRFYNGPQAVTWPGRLIGAREQVDAKTRSVTLMVAVDAPFERARPEDKPPLLKGTYCEVEFRGKPLPNRIVIPRAAIYDGHVYVLDKTSHLERKPVQIAFEQSDFAVVRSGLAPGEAVVVSDITPAISGILVQPVPDEELLAHLNREAAGTEPLR